jgi:hypothetical protein
MEWRLTTPLCSAVETPASRDLSPPTPSVSDPITRLNAALEGRYHVEREGGMATVYLADDLRFGAILAASAATSPSVIQA